MFNVPQPSASKEKKRKIDDLLESTRNKKRYGIVLLQTELECQICEQAYGFSAKPSKAFVNGIQMSKNFQKYNVGFSSPFHGK